jgi:peptidoglycan/LPS O-acetylase OafA/YrhL
LILNVGSAIGVPLTLPTILGLFVRRVPSWAALFSIAMAVAPSLLALAGIGHWTFVDRTLWTMAAGTAGFLFSALFWRTTNDEYRCRVDGFFERMHRPVDFASEVGAESDGRQLLVIGRLSAVVASFVLLLLFIPNPPEGRIAIVALSMVIGTVAVLLIVAGRKRNLRRSSALASP